VSTTPQAAADGDRICDSEIFAPLACIGRAVFPVRVVEVQLSEPSPPHYLKLDDRDRPGRSVSGRPDDGRMDCPPDGPPGAARGHGAATGLVMSDRQSAHARPLGGMSVLLAEDNPTNQLVQVQMLESLGADVTLAADGAEALGILGDQSFDVALIDIEMPRISGIDLISRVRADPGAVADMPMIALTAYVMREQRAAIEQAGADGIIAKPILSIEKFGDEILGLISRRRERLAPAAAAKRVAASDQVGIDKVIFEKLWDSFDLAGRAELKSRIMQDIRSAVETAAAALRERDFQRLRASTHVLIAVAGIIGAQKLQSLARRLNSAGHAGDDSALDGDGAELVQEADRVLGFVSRK
jgi:CheY-like chemotaxis protein